MNTLPSPGKSWALLAIEQNDENTDLVNFLNRYCEDFEEKEQRCHALNNRLLSLYGAYKTHFFGAKTIGAALIVNDFFEMFRRSQNQNYYWEFCHPNVYKSTLINRFYRFGEIHPAKTRLIDFLTEEMEILKKNEAAIIHDALTHLKQTTGNINYNLYDAMRFCEEILEAQSQKTSLINYFMVHGERKFLSEVQNFLVEDIESTSNANFRWKGTFVDFFRVHKGLLESGEYLENTAGTEQAFFESLANFYCLNGYDHETATKSIRLNDDTKYPLNKAHEAFLEYLEKLDNKKR